MDTRIYPAYTRRIIDTYMGSFQLSNFSAEYDVWYRVDAYTRYCANIAATGYIAEIMIQSGYIFADTDFAFPQVPAPTRLGSSPDCWKGRTYGFNVDRPACPASLVSLVEVSYMRPWCAYLQPPPCKDPIDCYDITGLTITASMAYGPC